MTIPSLAASGIPAAAVLIALTCTALAATRPVLHAQTLPPQIRVFLDCERVLPGFPQNGGDLRGLRPRPQRSGRPRPDHEHRNRRGRARIHSRLHRRRQLPGDRPHAQGGHDPVGSGRCRAAAARDDAADRPAELRRARRRAAAARRDGPARERGRTPRRGRRPVEQLGLQPAGLRVVRRRRIQPAVAARRVRGGGSDHAGLEDHVRGGARSRDRRVRPRRGRARQGEAAGTGVSLAHRQVARRALVRRRSGRSSAPRPSTTCGSTIEAAPAIEFNVFPYSQYTRRQLRVLYLLGVQHVRYYEETLYGKLEETLPRHELNVTYEQRERWGSLQASLEGSQYLHDLTRYRLEADGEVSWRVVRGLSVSAEVNASRIRDQLSLPRRGATPGRDLPAAAGAPKRLPVRFPVQPDLLVRVDLQQRREPAVRELSDSCRSRSRCAKARTGRLGRVLH